jgi:hypothetical protein
MRKLGMAMAVLGLVGTGVALAQSKPPLLAPAPGGKAAPVAPPPATGGAPDKFAAPTPTPAPAPGPEATPAPPAADKFAAPPAPAPSPPATAERPRPDAPPADEPGAIRALRALIGPGTALSFREAVPPGPGGGAFRLRGVTFTRGDGRAVFEELSLEGTTPEAVEEAIGLGLTVTGADGTTATAGRLVLRGLAIGGASPAFDLLRLEVVAVQGERPFAIDQIAIEGIGPGRTGMARMDGLDMLLRGAVFADRLRLARVMLEGFDLSSLLTSMQDRRMPGRPGGRYRVAAEGLALTQAASPVAGIAAIRVEGEVDGAGVDTGRIAVEGLRVEGAPPPGAPPRPGQAPAPGGAQWLGRLGYTSLAGGLMAETRHDPAAQRFELRNLTLSGENMGVLSLGFLLEGVTLPDGATMPDGTAARLGALALSWQDRSLLGRLAQAEATASRSTVRRVREGWAAQAATLLAGAPDITGPLGRVLRGEASTLELAARPQAPVGLMEVPQAFAGGGAAVVRLLGLSAVAR